MLEVRRANLMELAASLPRPAERLDMRYQWIKRLLANDLADSDAVMAPFGREVLERLTASGQLIVLMIDQTPATALHQAVASAAEELSASIREIASQVCTATLVTSTAVDASVWPVMTHTRRSGRSRRMAKDPSTALSPWTIIIAATMLPIVQNHPLTV